MVGKYVSLQDSYKSIAEAFIHAGGSMQTEVKVRWVYSGDIESGDVAELLKGVDGVLIAPGFGDRGIEGKLKRQDMPVKTIFRYWEFALVCRL